MVHKTKYGLSSKHLQTIRAILQSQAAHIEQVDLFGSRATGVYREYSDVDLVLYGSIDEKMTDRLWTLFHESDLPYKVDVQAYHLIDHPPLREHIDQVRQPLFTSKELTK